MTKVSINIVTWNSLKFLSACLESVRAQSWRNFSVLIVDNGSTDGTIEFIKTNYPEFGILRNTKNLGFSRAHNQGIRLVMAHWLGQSCNLDRSFVLVANPDIILEPDFLENLMNHALDDKYNKMASFGGKLLRAAGRDGETGLQEYFKSRAFDSAGLEIKKNRSARDRGASTTDAGQFNQVEEVFGISGALVLYRASALEEVKILGEYFDEDFFMYKEDVDLAWRLQNLGWGALYVSPALAYHVRGASPPRESSLRALIKNRKNRSEKTRFYSYRNHGFLILKNDYARNFLLFLPHWFWYEFKKLFFLSLFEPKTLAAIPSFLRRAPKMFAKRYEIMKKIKVKPAEIRKWFK